MEKIYSLIAVAVVLFTANIARAEYRPPIHGNLNIADVGATDRVELPALRVQSCTIQAFSGNAGAVYVGGVDVTNASGAKRGIRLAPGEPFNSIDVQDASWLYVAADNAGDDVTYFCN